MSFGVYLRIFRRTVRPWSRPDIFTSWTNTAGGTKDAWLRQLTMVLKVAGGVVKCNRKHGYHAAVESVLGLTKD